MTEDPKISQRYRELPREEPPRHVDEAILAAARRATGARPAPLVVPVGRRRWYFPLAAAAIIVLAVAVTVQVQKEPDPEAVVPPIAASKVPADEPAVQPAPRAEPPTPPAKREVFTPDPKPAPAQERSAGAAADSRELRAQRDAAQRADLEKAQKDAVGGVRESQQAKAALRARAEAVTGAAANFAAASPEQWLQGIADLRRQGRDDEADRQLAEFRKRYPDYRISGAILEKVEKK